MHMAAATHWPEASRRPTPVKDARPPQYVATLTVALLVLALPALALDPRRALTQYVHRSWQADQGLPQVSVEAIAQTPDGYLWLGTEGGLVRFDGVRLMVFDRKNTPELGSNLVRALFVDRQGTLWIGSSGLTRFRDGRFEPVDGLGSAFIFSMFEDRAGDLWIGTNGSGLKRLRQGKVATWSTPEGLTSAVVTALHEQGNGILWIGTRGGGLNRMQDGQLTAFPGMEAFAGQSINSIAEDRGGRLWVATDQGLVRFEEGRVTGYTTRDGLPKDVVQAVHEDRDGTLWVGTYGGGLVRLKDGRFEVLSTRQGLSDDIVWSLLEDAEGSLWIGTLGGGLNQLSDGAFVNYGTPEGLPRDFVRTVHQDQAGDMWIGTYGGGLARIHGERVEVPDTRKGLKSDLIWALATDSQGGLWIGTYGGGVGYLRGGKVHNFTTQEGLGSNQVWALAVDRDGDTWVGTNGGGLSRIRAGKVVTTYRVKDGITNDTVVSLRAGRDGSLWIGTRGGGLNRLRDGSFTAFTTRDGLSSDTIKVIHEEEDGTLWIGTAGGGLNRFRNGKFAPVTSKQGLFDDIVHQILDDGQGRFWMSCNRGIYWVTREALNDVADGRSPTLAPAAYGRADGLRSAECNSGHPAGFRALDGRLWFPTVRGVSVVDPKALPRSTQAPPVVVEDAFIDGVRAASGSADRPPGKGDLEFRYAALTFRTPERLRFRYRLQGYQDAWVDAGDRRIAYYTNIAPGRYAFEVAACNLDPDGLCVEGQSQFAFLLRPHFYQTRWFFALMGCLVAASVMGIHRLRTATLRRRAWELERRVEDAVDKVEVLRGLLPMCAWCKRIRDDEGYWNDVDAYIHAHTLADFTHGICPSCAQEAILDLPKRETPKAG